MKITNEFASLMSYITLLLNMSDEGIDIGHMPLNNLELDFLDIIVEKINKSITDSEQAQTFILYIKQNIQDLYPVVLEQYSYEIEEQNKAQSRLLN